MTTAQRNLLKILDGLEVLIESFTPGTGNHERTAEQIRRLCRFLEVSRPWRVYQSPMKNGVSYEY